MKIFVFLCLISSALAINECGKNQNFTECGTSCPLTCDNYNNPPEVCTEECKERCQCKDGYVETMNGTCVTPGECPIKCGENQNFTECGTSCPLTCDNYNNPPEVCMALCKRGCQCNEGYVETMNGTCVTPDKCPIDCGANQNFTECGTACPLTCDNYDKPPEPCILICKIGCVCNEGYVKTSNGCCVKPEDCPKKECEENQIYDTCGTACPLTCDNCKNPPEVCTQQCIKGCRCKDGYVKYNERCIKPKECPAVSR